MFFKKTSAGIEYLIAGLGNPGARYRDTRHNAGFMAADVLCEKYDIRLKSRFGGHFGTFKAENMSFGLLMPETYMNLSGQSVGQAMRFYKLPPERCIILFDDVTLPLGRLRVRRSGSHGGHNGMRNIIDYCGGDGFPRVKIGVGSKPHENMELADYVTSRFKSDELPVIKSAAELAAEAALYIAREGPDAAMGIYNGRGV